MNLINITYAVSFVGLLLCNKIVDILYISFLQYHRVIGFLNLWRWFYLEITAPYLWWKMKYWWALYKIQYLMLFEMSQNLSDEQVVTIWPFNKRYWLMLRLVILYATFTLIHFGLSTLNGWQELDMGSYNRLKLWIWTGLPMYVNKNIFF